MFLKKWAFLAATVVSSLTFYSVAYAKAADAKVYTDVASIQQEVKTFCAKPENKGHTEALKVIFKR